MITTRGIIPSELSKAFLEKLVGSQFIYEYYLKKPVRIKKLYSSVLREGDTNPSLNFFYSHTGELLYKDFAHSTGDFVSFVMNMFNSSREEALKRIYIDIVLSGKVEPNHIILKDYKRKNTEMSFEIKAYNSNELNLWKDWGITYDTLKYYNTYSANRLLIEGYLKWKSTIENPLFIYYYKKENKLKAYRPLAKKGEKFRTNCTTDIVDGWEELPKKGELLIITKARKEIMLYKEYNIASIAPISETTLIKEDKINNLIDRFKTIITNFDNDETGIKYSYLYKDKYGFESWNVPKEKDLTDYRKIYGEIETNKLIKELL